MSLTFLRYGSIERALRSVLTERGYGGRGAAIRELHLVAIERPGWVRVFLFEVDASRDGERERLLGVVRDDGRSGSEIEFVDSHDEREQLLARWSRGMIVRRARVPQEEIDRTVKRVFLVLVAIFGAAITAALFHAFR